MAEVGQLWLAACEDAERQPETQVVLYPLPGDPGDGAAALHLEPGSDVFSNAAWPLSPNQLDDANSAAKRDLHRVLVRDFSSPRIALGRLRHELEHARQYDRSPQIYVAMGFPRDALSRAFEERRPPTMTGSAALYNVLPPEEDANRAAASLTTSYFGPPSSEELSSTDAPLFRDPSPVQPDTLALRVLAFSALFPSEFAWVAERREESLRDLLDRLGPDAKTGWDLLRCQPDIAEHGQVALAACPSEMDVETAHQPAEAWAPVKRALQRGKAAAEEVLRDVPLDLF